MRKPKSIRVGKLINFLNMKKLLFIASGIVMLTLASCSKECTCTTKYSGEGTEEMTDIVYVYESEGKCSTGNSTISAGGVTMTTTCE